MDDDGFVNLFTQQYLTMECAMDSKHYPHDEQICSIKLESDFESDYIMKLKFADYDDDLNLHGFSIWNNLTLTGYKIKGITTSQHVKNHMEENYTVLLIDITLKRSITAYITQYFFPSTLLVHQVSFRKLSNQPRLRFIWWQI